MLIGQLLRPFGYLSIQHPYKWIVDWLYPLVLSVVTMITICLMSNQDITYAPGSLISLVLSFVQSLPGFYIAALAAIATFGRSDIDNIIPEPTPKVIVKFRGATNIVDLTRRKFLAMLFAFLTAQSIVIVIFSIFLLSFGKSICAYSYSGLPVGLYISGILLLAYFLMLYQMIVATFWGLYYLGYKLME
ncbi:hypothetical protein C4K29_2071 [Pseudomonas chlororaphis subsp. piscium]|uniref:hypothetical protein n=1 Tax=Pseudomonas chlororaphis TaxID=587753 RepID=UPI000F5713CB|nr:hypothetical protein [Pseudomonas chlororaphis]AZC88374.1 hypothetical protein C4K29_2071 [Pseudomonas chlororaphis subsp. piscium]